MKKIFHILLSLIAWQSAQAATFDVNVGAGGFNFSPSDITINVGDTVRWVRQSAGHDVVSPGNFNSDFPMPATFSHTFNSAGTFNYF